MVEQGVLTKRLAKCVIPVCSLCLYERMNTRPRIQCYKNNMDEAKDTERPGDVIFLDQLKSPTLVLISQMTGFMTTKRYQYATVYVDQASRLSYV